MKRRKVGFGTVMVVIALVPILYLIIALAGPRLRSHQQVQREIAARQAHMNSIKSLWASEAFTALADSDDAIVKDAIQRAVQLDSAGANTPVADIRKRKLVETLAAQVSSRGAMSPEDYMNLAKSDRATRWITPADQADWSRTRMFFEREIGHAPEGDDPSIWLEEFVTHEFEIGHRLQALATGLSGSRVLLFRVRALEQIGLEVSRTMTHDEFQYWFNNEGHPSANFRIAKRSLAEVLRSEGSALIAVSNMLVRIEDDTIYNWHSIWYWDDTNQAWQVFVMARKGWNGSMYN